MKKFDPARLLRKSWTPDELARELYFMLQEIPVPGAPVPGMSAPDLARLGVAGAVAPPSARGPIIGGPPQLPVFLGVASVGTPSSPTTRNPDQRRRRLPEVQAQASPEASPPVEPGRLPQPSAQEYEYLHNSPQRENPAELAASSQEAATPRQEPPSTQQPASQPFEPRGPQRSPLPSLVAPVVSPPLREAAAGRAALPAPPSRIVTPPGAKVVTPPTFATGAVTPTHQAVPSTDVNTNAFQFSTYVAPSPADLTRRQPEPNFRPRSEYISFGDDQPRIALIGPAGIPGCQFTSTSQYTPGVGQCQVYDWNPPTLSLDPGSADQITVYNFSQLPVSGNQLWIIALMLESFWVMPPTWCHAVVYQQISPCIGTAPGSGMIQTYYMSNGTLVTDQTLPVENWFSVTAKVGKHCSVGWVDSTNSLEVLDC